MSFTDVDKSEARSGSPLRFVFALIELWVFFMAIILGAAFVMNLLGANPDASFTAWIYARAEQLMIPFEGIFEPINLTGNTVIETSLLFAAVVYAFVGAAVAAASRRFG